MNSPGGPQPSMTPFTTPARFLWEGTLTKHLTERITDRFRRTIIIEHRPLKPSEGRHGRFTAFFSFTGGIRSIRPALYQLPPRSLAAGLLARSRPGTLERTAKTPGGNLHLKPGHLPLKKKWRALPFTGIIVEQRGRRSPGKASIWRFDGPQVYLFPRTIKSPQRAYLRPSGASVIPYWYVYTMYKKCYNLLTYSPFQCIIRKRKRIRRTPWKH